MHPALKAMLHDPVTIAPYTGQDLYGSPSYGAPVTYLGRIERHFLTMLGTTGAQLVESTQIFLAEDAVIDERSQLSIEGKTISIQGLKLIQDARGNLDHYLVYL